MKISINKPFIGIMLLMVLGNMAQGITIRDDRNDSLYTSLANDSFPAGGIVTGTWLGSGTLISPNWILTAKHVLVGANTFKTTAGNVSLAEIISHPSLDIGLARLATPITSIDPINLYDLDFGIEDYQDCILLGAGNTGTGLSGQISGTAGTRRAAESRVYKNASAWGWSSSQLLTWFRKPTSGAANLEGSGTNGDSGGGLLLNVDGEYAIAGVMSQAWSGGSGGSIIGQYDTGGVYVRSAPLNDWILQYATDAIIISDVPANTPPVANNDIYSIHVSDVLNVSAPGVLSNDVDADGDSLTAIRASNPTDGDLTFSSDGSFTYDPDTNFFGTDTFTYRANDGTDSSNLATITIDVYNNAPTVGDDAYEFDAADYFIQVSAFDGILANDTDVDGDFFRPVLQDNVENGYLVLNQDGSFTYIPNDGFSGTDTFTYNANDGWDNSELATVTLTVNPLLPEMPGDANRDGKVDGSDVTILAGNWQVGVTGGGATWDMGDFNADGKVDGSDVTILAGNWQSGVTAAASVPEPSTLTLLLLGSIGVLGTWRRRAA